MGWAEPDLTRSFRLPRIRKRRGLRIAYWEPAVPQVYGLDTRQTTFDASLRPWKNHNLIASDRSDNYEALEEILRKVSQ